ncbi:MAG: GNAT family N-acetyltransferase [Candidatus Lokiarchaeota archaeon]|nr:GNAT family N-acetyltransferase [Candidatus Lokiarchaeota archaeon]
MSVKFRIATIEDIYAISSVHVKSWQSTYLDIFPAEQLNAVSIEQVADNWTKIIKIQNKKSIVYVADDSVAGIVGFLKGGKPEDLSSYDCEISAIYILREFQRKGIGRQLVRKAIEYFISQQWKTMIVWTLINNPYRRFYDLLGGEPRETKNYKKWNTNHELIGYTWENIQEILVS